MEIDFPFIWNELSERFHCVRESVHGPDHWKRVEENGIQLAKHTPHADIIVIRLFAVFHDSQRMNDWGDPEHGPRAAEFVMQKQRQWLKLSEEQLSLLTEACIHHTDGTCSNNPTIGCCWDADRLDLPRVGITPHVEFMSTQAGRDVVQQQYRNAFDV